MTVLRQAAGAVASVATDKRGVTRSQPQIHDGPRNALSVAKAMYGRRPRCKRNLTYLRIVRVQPCMRPVFRVEACPVAMQPLWLLALM